MTIAVSFSPFFLEQKLPKVNDAIQFQAFPDNRHVPIEI
jgi:hypothetical protein